MVQNVIQAGDRIYISGYSPFRGLSGIIQQVDIVAEFEKPVCFYLVKLEKTQIREAVWFLDDEVEQIDIY